jgi:hypothetical protein
MRPTRTISIRRSMWAGLWWRPDGQAGNIMLTAGDTLYEVRGDVWRGLWEL